MENEKKRNQENQEKAQNKEVQSDHHDELEIQPDAQTAASTSGLEGLPPPLEEGEQSSKEKQKITKDMSIMEIVTQYPETIEPLLKAGLHCIGCYLSPYETLEQGTVGHGMEEEDLNALLEELNQSVNQHIREHSHNQEKKEKETKEEKEK